MTSLDRNILHSSISVPAKLRLYYRVFVLPIIQFPTQQLARILDAFDMWCLRRILYAFPGGPAFLMKRSTDQPPLMHIIRTTRLKFFGHIARANPSTDLCGPFANGLEPPIRPTASHLVLDCWIRSSTTQHWSGNRLLSSAESSSLEHAHRYGNVQHRTSHTMMMMVMTTTTTTLNMIYFQFKNWQTSALIWRVLRTFYPIVFGVVLCITRSFQNVQPPDWVGSLDSKSSGSLSLRTITSRGDLSDFNIGTVPKLRYEISRVITEDW